MYHLTLHFGQWFKCKYNRNNKSGRCSKKVAWGRMRVSWGWRFIGCSWISSFLHRQRYEWLELVISGLMIPGGSFNVKDFSKSSTSSQKSQSQRWDWLCSVVRFYWETHNSELGTEILYWLVLCQIHTVSAIWEEASEDFPVGHFVNSWLMGEGSTHY